MHLPAAWHGRSPLNTFLSDTKLVTCTNLHSLKRVLKRGDVKTSSGCKLQPS